MNILHILSQTHLTGSEVYAADLCKFQTQQRHKCFIISDTLSVKTSTKYFPMPIHNRKYINRIYNIKALIKFCKIHKIDLIHAHSRAGSWLINIVRLFIDVAYVSTIHGRQSVHFSSKNKNIYGRRIIAVCDHLQEHILNELYIDEKVYLIRNIIDEH
ncbi:glycosyltransferase [Bathymodiolus heckerae thiotrophic gill symbiont]|uniref:glycosyltransferase n=1 Tax=Bathymodiolus heckerae thiotrophic gill symbiont TaxID=1052212 RepID=UPI0010FF35D6|nr:glycosyltransferase [Bathymodiolus heckerae thiotrophic gill symbiont]